MTQARRRRRRTPPRWSENLDGLHDYLREPARRIVQRRVSAVDDGPVAVTDDWPGLPPISDAELRVIEGHFAKELDALFGALP